MVAVEGARILAEASSPRLLVRKAGYKDENLSHSRFESLCLENHFNKDLLLQKAMKSTTGGLITCGVTLLIEFSYYKVNDN